MTTRRVGRRRERRRSGCLGVAVGTVWLLVAVVACYGFVLRPALSRYVGDRIGSELGGGPQEQIEQVAGQVLPTAVAALPPGEIIVTEQQANDYLVANQSSFAPLESVRVRFVPGELQADLQAQGFTSTATLGLEARNGQLVVVNPQLEGLLSEVISADEVAQSLVQQLNSQLSAQGKSAQSVRVEQGQVVIVIG